MSEPIRVVGPDLRDLSQRIKKHADGKAIRKEMTAGFTRATKEIRADQKASIPASLPSRGGLASLVHRTTRLRNSVRTGARTAGVRIVATNKEYDVGAMNRGRLRHPVFGRPPMVIQTAGVMPRFLDEPVEKSKEDVRRELIRVMVQIARKVE